MENNNIKKYKINYFKIQNNNDMPHILHDVWKKNYSKNALNMLFIVRKRTYIILTERSLKNKI